MFSDGDRARQIHWPGRSLYSHVQPGRRFIMHERAVRRGRWTISLLWRSSASRVSNSLGTFVMQESNLERTFADVAVLRADDRVARTRLKQSSTPPSAPRSCGLQPCRDVILPHDVQGMSSWWSPSRENWVSRSSDVSALDRSYRPAAERDREGRGRSSTRAGRSRSSSAHGANRSDRRSPRSGQPRRCRNHHRACAASRSCHRRYPFHTQQLGLLGSLPSLHQMPSDCDTLVTARHQLPVRPVPAEDGDRPAASRSI